MMNTLVQSIEQGLKPLFSEEESRSLAWWIAEEVTGKNQTQLLLDETDCKDTKYSSYIEKILLRLQQKEPIQYIFGHTCWRGLDLKVTPATLIPRPETAELVDWILGEHSSPVRILDIGTGSGCIALALKFSRPLWDVHAIDISEKALAVAKENAQRLALDVTFTQADVLNHQSPITNQPYDIVVSNPPYVRPSDEVGESVRLHEPHSALFVPEDDPLLFYRAIAKRRLGKEVYFEINECLADETQAMLQQEGYTDIEVRKDSYGKNRFIRARVAE